MHWNTSGPPFWFCVSSGVYWCIARILWDVVCSNAERQFWCGVPSMSRVHFPPVLLVYRFELLAPRRNVGFWRTPIDDFFQCIERHRIAAFASQQASQRRRCKLHEGDQFWFGTWSCRWCLLVAHSLEETWVKIHEQWNLFRCRRGA